MPNESSISRGSTATSLVATLATRAGLLVMAEAERAAALDRVRDYLAARAETSRGEFDLPMLTGVHRSRRLFTRDLPRAY